jgi:hypothetical protein
MFDILLLIASFRALAIIVDTPGMSTTVFVKLRMV